MSRFISIMFIMALVSIVLPLHVLGIQVDSEEIIKAFEIAGDNSTELQKAIDHYKDSDDQKMQAVLFLIANMEEHSYATYRLFDTAGVDVNLDVLSFPTYDSLTEAVRQIEQERGEIDYEKTELIFDLPNITAAFLINQIDYAFKAWHEKPWAKNFDFKQFCRYILPYRGSNEPLEEWRQYFYDKYDHIQTQMENPNNPLEAAAIINDDIKTWFGFDPRYYYHPTDQGLTEMIESKLGRCEDMTNITIYAMRANGLAVTSDYTPYWANSGNNHAWNSIVTAEGNVIPFMGAEASPGSYKLSGKVGKVYRKTYDIQKDNLIFQVPEGTEIPRWLKGKNYIDVTADYTDVADVAIQFKRTIPDSVEIAYLCVFNSGKWKAIQWGRVDDNFTLFKDMGTDIAYLPAIYQNEEIVPWGTPFVLHKNGSMTSYGDSMVSHDNIELMSTSRRKQVESTDGIEQTSFTLSKNYELFYWANDWISIGSKTADENPLVFDKVPVNSLYWLVEEGSDKEERIFTLDKDGKQIWW